MDKEAFARYVAGLSDDLHELATNIIRRVERLVNQDRIKLLDDVQRVERRLSGISDRVGEIDDRMRRGLAQQDDLLDRVAGVEGQMAALARRMAELQPTDDALEATRDE